MHITCPNCLILDDRSDGTLSVKSRDTIVMEALYVHIANKLEGIRFGRPKASGKLIDLSELKSLDLWRAVFAEFLAQLLFVFLGCASTSFTINNVQIALCFGLAIMALVQMIGHVSGGHINAAVTIAMAVAMNITVVRAFLYVVAQVVGAIVGGLILKGLTPEKFHNRLGITVLGEGVSPAQGFGIELILTFCLVAVIFGTTDPNRASFGSPSLLIGLTVTVGHLAAVQYTGSSMNPTRTLGSAVAANIWRDHWVYWVGPIAGGVVAALVYKLVLNPYKGVTNMDEAISKLTGDDSAVVVIPRDYFKGDEKGEKPSSVTTHISESFKKPLSAIKSSM